MNNKTLTSYSKFIDSKRHSSIDHGISKIEIPKQMFDFQEHVTRYAIKKGRCAVFLDTGLGKTFIELAVAQNYLRHTNKRVLIITPLAVAFQHLAEAKNFNINGIEYSKKGKFTEKIVICNYERLQYFDPKDFDCVILDESSILKNFDGARKDQITKFLRKIKYRFIFTATPSPNDFTELGTSAEALGYMGYMDMLSKYFKNNQNSIDIRHAGSKWYLKPHAKEAFWQWVNSWSIAMRKPSDLGYSDDNFTLPDLNTVHNKITNDTPLVVNDQPFLFNVPAVNFQEIRAEVKSSLDQRCEKALEVSESKPTTVYWVNRNDESKLIAKLDSDAVELLGTMKIEQKEEILEAFGKGEIKKLITKPTITGFGLNWQHCAHTVFFPTFSYEQYYQAIRRFWRFGQKKKVTVDLVYSAGQERILKSLDNKAGQADEMFSYLVGNMSEYKDTKEKKQIEKIEKPSFLK